MSDDLLRIKPKITPPLDEGFRPFYLALRTLTTAAVVSRKPQTLAFALERAPGSVSVFRTVALPLDHPEAEQNKEFAERILKFLLWQRGAYKISVVAPAGVVDYLKEQYRDGGARDFDFHFLRKIYEVDALEIIEVAEKDLPAASEKSAAIGRHLHGNRIGFDAGGSDRKVAAVVNGEEVWSTETVWQPKIETDPQYHIDGINASIAEAVEHLPGKKIDAIGVSSAGVYVNNRVMAASLFRKIPEDQFNEKIKDVYIDMAKKWGDVPMEVANDGDVTALAGSMSLNKNAVLGIAMGTSQAVGYVDGKGHITGWLNELAFVPVDLAEGAPLDSEWSGDKGTGVNCFSQDAAIRLAPKIGLELDAAKQPGSKLKDIQEAFKNGNQEVIKIYQSIGVFLGYAILQYTYFYDIKHVIILGRVTSGQGGDLILETARRTMEAEDLAAVKNITLSLPDERMRRVGQSIAAASLPALDQ